MKAEKKEDNTKQGKLSLSDFIECDSPPSEHSSPSLRTSSRPQLTQKQKHAQFRRIQREEAENICRKARLEELEAKIAQNAKEGNPLSDEEILTVMEETGRVDEVTALEELSKLRGDKELVLPVLSGFVGYFSALEDFASTLLRVGHLSGHEKDMLAKLCMSKLRQLYGEVDSESEEFAWEVAGYESKPLAELTISIVDSMFKEKERPYSKKFFRFSNPCNSMCIAEAFCYRGAVFFPQNTVKPQPNNHAVQDSLDRVEEDSEQMIEEPKEDLEAKPSLPGEVSERERANSQPQQLPLKIGGVLGYCPSHDEPCVFICHARTDTFEVIKVLGAKTLGVQEDEENKDD